MDYFPASLSLPSGAAASTAYFMPVRFRPSYVDYKEQNVGVQLAYNHRGLFSAALRGVYAHYMTRLRSSRVLPSRLRLLWS